MSLAGRGSLWTAEEVIDKWEENEIQTLPRKYQGIWENCRTNGKKRLPQVCHPMQKEDYEVKSNYRLAKDNNNVQEWKGREGSFVLSLTS